MSEETLYFPHSTLAAFARQLLEAAGAPDPKAALVADTLVTASVRGVDSHGVQLLRFYVEQLEAGGLNAQAEGHVISEIGTCLHYDGENGLGAVVSEKCCGHAVRLAHERGAGVVIARDSNHFGAAAYWGQRISSEGMVGIVMCNATPLVPPWQGREGRVGTNPICVSVPGAGGKSWLLDMATTTVAMGKIYRAAMSGQPAIPPGWAMDSEGRPTTDTQIAMHGGLLMPLGGYKGSGLGMMVEIFCGVLGGGAMSTDVGGVRTRGRATRISQTFVAIDVACFMPVGEFQARLAELVERVKATPPAAGYDEVLVAGEPEWRAEEERQKTGIPLNAGVWEELVKAAHRLGVTPPDAGHSAFPLP
jgi:LDH2 family malate/lactate/ureidoglycolate dehydrogenase